MRVPDRTSELVRVDFFALRRHDRRAPVCALSVEASFYVSNHGGRAAHEAMRGKALDRLRGHFERLADAFAVMPNPI